ncbi:hypothetical protein [Salinibaculum rarum]|uniref:hypothetical protein n=1 Tax=Salinibaculum rarum TaxID=3058903 RepID=UPI00265E152E|nr:hypothetical protein [Salinibaculum sp. KK48]
MVGPVSDEERNSFAAKLKLGFVLLVALSAGLITLQADAGPVAFVGASVAGGLVGVVLVWIAFPDREELADSEGVDDGPDW